MVSDELMDNVIGFAKRHDLGREVNHTLSKNGLRSLEYMIKHGIGNLKLVV